MALLHMDIILSLISTLQIYAGTHIIVASQNIIDVNRHDFLPSNLQFYILVIYYMVIFMKFK
jgi:hypothetical protein